MATELQEQNANVCLPHCSLNVKNKSNYDLPMKASPKHDRFRLCHNDQPIGCWKAMFSRKKHRNNKMSSVEDLQMANVGSMTGSVSSLQKHLEVQGTGMKNVRVQAQFSYAARASDELSFTKGDLFSLLSSEMSGWQFAVALKTKQKGYIPSNYFLVDSDQSLLRDSWHKVSRCVAQAELLQPGNEPGSFIIRPASNNKHLAMSILLHDNESNTKSVKHYKLQKDENGHFFINKQNRFRCIEDLILHHQKNADSLQCRLGLPCPKTLNPVVQFRDFEVDRNCIQLGEMIGSGHFGTVHKAEWNNTLTVAVKVPKEMRDVAAFLQEAKVMHRLQHPRIVQLLGVCTKPNDEPIYIITELMHKGSLNAFLKGDEGKVLHFEDLIAIISQIAEGMAYLESQQSVHRDLRAANILVDKWNMVKVADFGLAKIITETIKTVNVSQFPVKWTAPEACRNNQLFTTKSDVWSFGVVVYEIVTYGSDPYPDIPKGDIFPRLRDGYRLPNPNRLGQPCPDELYELMLKCWSKSPADRPTFLYLRAIMKHWCCSTEVIYSNFPASSR